MKLLKQMVLTTLLVSASFGVQAKVYNLGTLSDEYSNIFEVKKGTFTDTFNFNVGTRSTDFLISNLYTANAKGKVLRDISNLSMSLFNSSGFVASGIEFTALTTGSYSMNISGKGVGKAGGGYGVDLSISPVPEVETYSMMLVGIGLMGFIARRRRAD